MKHITLMQRLLIVCGLTLSLVGAALAQTSSSLSGTVHDPQGKAVAGAKVSLSNTAGTTQLDTTTNGEGFYTFPVIQPGNYTVTIEATGFKKSATSGIVVNASDKQSIGTTRLEVGDISNTVEVTADAAQLLIKTESGEQSTAINNQQLQNLAVNGRNYLDLLKLTPGVVQTGGFATSGPGGLGSIDINGTRTGSVADAVVGFAVGVCFGFEIRECESVHERTGGLEDGGEGGGFVPGLFGFIEVAEDDEVGAGIFFEPLVCPDF